MAYPQLRASITSNATDTNAASVVCTHPTGLTAGDLMVLFVAIANFGADRTITTPTDWTSQASVSFSDRRILTAYKKIATAGDVSAGSTTVSFSGDVDKFCYSMFAVTGSASDSEITLSETDDVTPAGVTTLTGTTALTPLVAESLVFSAFFATDLDLSAILTASSFTLTPTTTMTERVDVGVRDGASDGCSLFIATGEYAGVSQITSRSVTVSESITGSSSAIIFLVNAPQTVTVDVSHLAVTPTVESVTASAVTVVADVSHLAITPTINGVETITSSDRTQWTNENKPASTTWTNQTK